MNEYTHVQKFIMDSMRFKNKTIEWFIWKTVIHDDNEFYQWSK